MTEGVVDDFEVIEIEEKHRHRASLALREGQREREMLLEEPPIRESGQRVVIRLILHLLLGALSVRQIENLADHPRDVALRIELRAIGGGDPSLPIGAGDHVRRLGERDCFAAQYAREDLVDRLFA